jgi:hypothetical protein
MVLKASSASVSCAALRRRTKGSGRTTALPPAHKGSFRLEYIWLGNQNLWRIRHTRPESSQLDSRVGGRKIILAHLCASFGGAADSIVHED